MIMSRKIQDGFQKEAVKPEVPAWARDNFVLKLLEDHGMRLEVNYDLKYLNGLCNKPLIVIRSKKTQSYL